MFQNKEHKDLLIAGLQLIGLLLAGMAVFLFNAWPSLVGGQASVKRWYLVRNMRMLKDAVEGYSLKEGHLPDNVEKAKIFFPGGPAIPAEKSRDDRFIAKATAPVNPYTRVSEWPKTVTRKDKSDNWSQLKEGLSEGQIAYIRLLVSNSYAIVSEDGHGDLMIWRAEKDGPSMPDEPHR